MGTALAVTQCHCKQKSHDHLPWLRSIGQCGKKQDRYCLHYQKVTNTEKFLKYLKLHMYVHIYNISQNYKPKTLKWFLLNINQYDDKQTSLIQNILF